MRISDILSICVRNLTRRKLRTFLTALGVVIGVGLIIIAISIGIGLSRSYEEQLASWGDLTVIDIYNWKLPGHRQKRPVSNERQPLRRLPRGPGKAGV